MEVPYGAWPWRLLTSGEQAGRAGCDLEVHHQFLAEHACCLDDPFGQWFRRLVATERDFGKPAIQTLLGQLRRQGAANMPLEGLLAEIKASTPRSGKNVAPLAERMGYLGLLTQLLHGHMAGGGTDPRSSQQALRGLVEQGVLQRPQMAPWRRKKAVRSPARQGPRAPQLAGAPPAQRRC